MKKKLVFLILIISFLFLLSGFRNIKIYGTEYLETKCNYSFIINQTMVDESLSCNGYTGTFQEWDDRVGNSPYLDAIDDNDTHDAVGGAYIVEYNNANKDEGWFTFNDTSEVGFGFTVNFTFRVSCIDGDNDSFYVFYDETGSDPGTGTQGPFVSIASTTYINKTVTLPGTFNATEVNNMRIMLRTSNEAQGDNRYVDYVNMTIYRGA